MSWTTCWEVALLHLSATQPEHGGSETWQDFFPCLMFPTCFPKHKEPGFAGSWLEKSFLHCCVYDGVGNKTTIPNLSRASLSELTMPKPAFDEQREIVAILDASDQNIDLHHHKRTVQDELFKTLLHKSMTGEIRAADRDLSTPPASPPVTTAWVRQEQAV